MTLNTMPAGSSAHLRPLVDPQSIAVYGASSDLKRLGGMPIALLQERGFKGAIYPINPKYGEIAGLRCYPDIESLPEAPDLVVVAVAAPDVLPVLRKASKRGIRAAVIFAAGFAEAADNEGLTLQAELVEAARTLDMAIAGPNCMGFGNLDSHAYSTFTAIFRTVEPPVQPLDTGLVTQSGSVCSAVYAAGRQLDVRFNVVINTGNEACVEFSEYLEYLADRPGTQAIVGYIEGLRDGDRFTRVATRMRDEGRLLALLKAGDTTKGAQAAASHTASLAGSGAVYRAVFDRLCVVQAHDIPHLADIAYLARFRHRASGPRVGILTISGAIGALLADAFTKAGVDVPDLGPAVRERLHEGIPRYGMVHNPVDFTGNIVNRHEFVAEALRALLESGEVDFAVLYAPGFLLDRMAPTVCALSRECDGLISVISTGTVQARPDFEQAGVPVFDDMTRAVNALSSLAMWHHNRGRIPRPSSRPTSCPPQAHALVAAARERGHRALHEHDAKQLFSLFGLPVASEQVAHSATGAVTAATAIGYPVVLKVLSPDILHKSDAGAVRTNITDAAGVRAAFEAIGESVAHKRPDARVEGLLVQKQQPAGVELLLGIVRDPVFGLVMTLGLGGVFTEIFADTVHAPLPVTAAMGESLLQSLKAWPLLNGYRGAARVDLAAIGRAMESLSDAALALGPDVDQMEINPLIARPDGVVAVDGLVLLVAAPGDGQGDGPAVADADEELACQPV